LKAIEKAKFFYGFFYLYTMMQVGQNCLPAQAGNQIVDNIRGFRELACQNKEYQVI